LQAVKVVGPAKLAVAVQLVGVASHVPVKDQPPEMVSVFPTSVDVFAHARVIVEGGPETDMPLPEREFSPGTTQESIVIVDAVFDTTWQPSSTAYQSVTTSCNLIEVGRTGGALGALFRLIKFTLGLTPNISGVITVCPTKAEEVQAHIIGNTKPRHLIEPPPR
jgi:hypothetical protein